MLNVSRVERDELSEMYSPATTFGPLIIQSLDVSYWKFQTRGLLRAASLQEEDVGPDGRVTRNHVEVVHHFLRRNNGLYPSKITASDHIVFSLNDHTSILPPTFFSISHLLRVAFFD